MTSTSNARSLVIGRHPVRCSYDADTDVLIVCEYGSVAEERMADQHIDVGDLRFFLRRPGGPVIGFKIARLSGFDVDGAAHDLWADPRFRVPALGLRRASVGEIVLRSRSAMAGRSTADVAAEGRGHELLAAQHFEGAALAFQEALDAGALRAHLGTAMARLGQGRYDEAYDSARIFTEFAPRNSWAWAWFGRTCVEVGAMTEAQRALRRAVALERKGSYPTPARQVLRTLHG